ncbi:hypothetical protein ACLI4Z_15890 [Natrialbaceae archaeon A-arb3/5]
MQILGCQVDWREDVANPPKLEVLVDEIPDLSEMFFEHDEEHGLWYAEREGIARFFAWNGPENEGGFAGRNYTITTVDGKEVTLRGPWSSRASAMNKVGFGPCVPVRITTEPEVLERGFTFTSRALTLEAAKRAVDLAESASHLQRVERYRANEPCWEPVPANRGDEA